MNASLSFVSEHPVFVGVAVVAALVLLSIRRSHRRTARAAEALRPRASAVFTSTMISALVIVAVEWIVASNNPSPQVLLSVLAIPALLAGATIGRIVAAAQLGNRIERGVRR